MVQWLRLCASYAEGTGLFPSQGTEIPHAEGCGQKVKKGGERDLSPTTSLIILGCFRTASTARHRNYKIVVCACMLSRVWLFRDPMDCSPPGSSVHGILQPRILINGLSFPSPGDLPHPGMKLTFLTLAEGFFYWATRETPENSQKSTNYSKSSFSQIPRLDLPGLDVDWIPWKWVSSAQYLRYRQCGLD